MPIIATTTAATSRKLTTVAAVKAVGTLDASDTVIGALIDRASALLEGLIGRVLAQERVTERCPLPARSAKAVLERRPVTAVHAVTFWGDALEAGAFRLLDARAGILQLDRTHALWPWGAAGGFRGIPEVEVDCTAGFVLPGDEGRTLPHDIEAAAIELTRWFWSAGKDLDVSTVTGSSGGTGAKKSENFGDYAVSYDVGSGSSSSSSSSGSSASGWESLPTVQIVARRYADAIL